MKRIDILIVFIVLALLLIITNRGYTQPDYKRSYEISVTNFLVKDITFDFTQRLNEKKSLEISNSYRLQMFRIYGRGLLLTMNDPSIVYNQYRFRIGVKHFIDSVIYICPMLIYNYAYFDDVELEKFENKSISYPKEVDVLSRTRYEFGGLIKIGFIEEINNHMIGEI